MNDELEAMVDEHGLWRVLDALAEVCRDKTSHMHANWQDKVSANVWERSAVQLEAVNGLPL